MIPLAEPNFTGREREYVAEAIASAHAGPDGAFVGMFEDMVAKAAGRSWAVAVDSGTAALHVAAYCLGFQGKAYDWPRHSFPAMWNIGQMLGCHVSPIGGGTDHDLALYREKHTLWPTLADRAPAIGGPPGEATLECYSFAANKTVTCGKGGAVVGDDDELRDYVRSAIRPGVNRSGVFNYRMANINAAIGCAQLERLDELRAAKARIWAHYDDAGLPMIERGPSRWMTTVEDHAGLVEAMAEKGIECRMEPGIGVSLPCSTGLTETDQDRVIDAYWSCVRGGQTEPPSAP